MKIRENGPILTINEMPVFAWLFGAFFMIVGATFVYGASGGYSNYEEATRFTLVAHFVSGMIALAVGFCIIQFTPVTWITIDRTNQTLAFKQRGLSKNVDRVHRFSEVKEFYLIEDKDSDGDPVWALGLAFTDGEEIRISAIDSHDEKFKRDMIFKANVFMYKQEQSYIASPKLNEMN